MTENKLSNIHLNCSQKVLTHYAKAYGMEDGLAIKLATGLGGGMGRMAGTCGAVSGAYLVLGLEYGPEHTETSSTINLEAKNLTYSKVREFHQRFNNLHGSCTCSELLGCDISTNTGYELAKNQDLMGKKCPNFINDAINIVEKIINDDKIPASLNSHPNTTSNNGR